jgi:hypothetical protein
MDGSKFACSGRYTGFFIYKEREDYVANPYEFN